LSGAPETIVLLLLEVGFLHIFETSLSSKKNKIKEGLVERSPRNHCVVIVGGRFSAHF
jgi:hypothetical protein